MQKRLNNIYYKEFGGKNIKDTILILHGWGGSSGSWIRVGELLAGKGYRVVIPDLPGFGKTKLEKIFTLNDYVDIIIEFINEKQKDYKESGLILWGHSNGGAIAIKIQDKRQKIKEIGGNFKIKLLILNNSAGIRNDKRRSLKRKIFFIIVKPLKFLAQFKVFKGLRKLFYKAIGSHDYINTEDKPFLKETYLNMISSDLSNEIKGINIPTLLIWGENDTYTPLSDGKFMNKNISNSKLVIMKGKKHGIHLKNPEELVSVFLQNCK